MSTPSGYPVIGAKHNQSFQGGTTIIPASSFVGVILAVPFKTSKMVTTVETEISNPTVATMVTTVETEISNPTVATMVTVVGVSVA